MNDYNKTTLPLADVEQNIGYECVAKKQAGKMDTRVNIHVISYRKARHDPDGVSAKAVIDGIVKAGILRNDSTDEVKKVSYESIKCKTYEEERTEIQIEFNEGELRK
jgi:hypothetical protein